MMHFRRLVLLFLFFQSASAVACECPLTRLGMEECNKYEIIFKGKIISVVNCDHKFGEAMFEVEELYKGNVAQKFKVLFECHVPCAIQFNPGEEWIIYSNYKQVENAMMDWCSRSRKHFNNEKEDFYAVTYGNDYDDEVKFLREHFGLHRFLTPKNTAENGRNIQPSQTQMVVILICSLLAIILFYWLFKKFVK